jgi:hypothetical protein
VNKDHRKKLGLLNNKYFKVKIAKKYHVQRDKEMAAYMSYKDYLGKE